MNRSLYIFLLFTFLLIGKTALTQDPNYITLGADIFANTNIYSLLYDEEQDILYTGTNRGVFAYKQNKFKQLLGPESQIGESVFNFKMDKKGNVHCMNLNGQIFKVVNNDLTLVYHLPKEYLGSRVEYFFDAKNRLIVSSIGVIRIEKEHVDTIFSLEDHYIFQDKEKYPEFVKGIPMTKDITKINSQAILSIRNEIYFLMYEDDKISKFQVPNPEKNFPQCGMTIINKRPYFIDSKHQLKLYSVFTGIHSTIPITDQAIGFRYDQELNYLFGSGTKNSFYVFEMIDEQIRIKSSFFSSIFISTSYSSANGTLFLGTFGEGIRIVPKSEVLIHAKEQELFLGITAVNDKHAYVSTRSGKIFSFEDSLIEAFSIPGNVDNVYYTTERFKEMFNQNVSFNYYQLNRTNSLQIKDLWQIDPHTMLIAGNSSIDIVSNQLKQINVSHLYTQTKKNSAVKNIYSGNRCSSVAFIQEDSSIYYSTNFGLFKRSWDKPDTQHLQYKGQSFLGNDLAVFEKQLICGTSNKGLLFFENDTVVRTLTLKDGLKSLSIKKILVDHDYLYILSANGLQLYDLKLNQFIFFGFAEGILSERVSNFSISPNKLWVMEKHAFYAIDKIKKTKEQSIANLFIDSITVNGNHLEVQKKHIFAHDENALQFFFDYRHLLSKKETIILYKLEGLYDDWKIKKSTENNIEFQSLLPGNYTFKIKAKYRNQESETYTFSFQILSPIWQRWWFYLLIIVVVTIIISVIARSKIKSNHEKDLQKLKTKAMEKNAIDAQLKALKAQMNPHFIFNAINSIQDLVLQNETIKSYDNLVLFSQLVRNTLDFSELESITLREEITYLETYLSLEKLRFQEDFTYAIKNEEPLDTKVPSLIVQPFIENALKHGLLHKSGHKDLQIHFYQADQLICEIIDNGIGREESASIKSRQNRAHKSFSTEAIRERLSILSKLFNQEVKYTINDLKSDDDEAQGTRVTIYFPSKEVFVPKS